MPPNPGNLSAFGLLAVDWRTDHLVTRVTPEDALDATIVAALYAGLEAEALAALERDGIPADRQRYVRQADVRYVGQSMEVRVEAPGGTIDAAALERLAEAFHATHEKTFGYAYRGAQKIEIVNFCLSGFGTIERPTLPTLTNEASSADAAHIETRPVFFSGSFRDTPVYERAGLPAGTRIEGPAIIQEFGSTTAIFPGQHVTVDPHGILIVRATGGEVERIR